MKTKSQAPPSADQRNTFTAAKFWDKIANIPKAKAHCNVIKKALTLYVILTEEDTPVLVKGCVVSALIYLIIPVDLVPDVFSYADDAALMAATLLELTSYVTPKVEQRVSELMPSHCL